VLFFLFGLVRVVRAPRVGARFALALSLVGIATFFIHLWFLWQGHPEFRVSTSWGILSGALVASLALGWQSIRVLRAPEPG
jgi:peptidoglycan/LPS O-acetylase OafA/YrhL